MATSRRVSYAHVNDKTGMLHHVEGLFELDLSWPPVINIVQNVEQVSRTLCLLQNPVGVESVEGWLKTLEGDSWV